ncbi:hypothetical protein ACW6QP_09210 [Salegentibacter sp. HM20]
MKRIFWFLAIIVLLFLGLVYLSVSGSDSEFETANIKDLDDLENTDFTRHDSVLLAASTLYEANALKSLMQGENYREAWASPVKVPVVFLDTLFDGMKIVKEGGGTQTHSLRLEDKDGFLYSLRSVTKDPSTHVPQFARNLGLENIVIDAISASHPYAALAVAELSNTAGVLHTHPRVLFVPKQNVLGEAYNEKYGNRLFLLEYETEGKKNWTQFESVEEIIDTKKLQEWKEDDTGNLKIDEAAYVRARLFDLLIGDWDRHAKQWGWVIQNIEGKRIATPLAGDRDNAFFNIDGIIPGIISSEHIEPLVRPFEEDIDYMPGLVYPNDVYFLHFTAEEIFLKEAEILQQLLTDEAIEQAFLIWPQNIRELDAKEIIQKIKSRRDNLKEHAREFYRVLQEKELLNEPLKGSEEIKISAGLQQCFECATKSRLDE